MSTNDKKTETMSAQNERRELVPVIIAGIVAAVGLFCLWSDLSDDSLGRGDGVITSAVISRAGVIVTPSQQPGHLSAPQTAPAFESAPPEGASRGAKLWLQSNADQIRTQVLGMPTTVPPEFLDRVSRMDAEKLFGVPARSFANVVDTLAWLRHTVLRPNSISID